MPMTFNPPVDSTLVPKIAQVVCVNIRIDMLVGQPESITLYYEDFDSGGKRIGTRQVSELLTDIRGRIPADFAAVYRILKAYTYSPEALTKAGYPAGGTVT